MNQPYPFHEQPATAHDAEVAQADVQAASELLRSTDGSLVGHLLRLIAQVGHIEARLDELWSEVQANSSQVAGLTRHLTDPAAHRLLEERLADLMSRQEASQQQLEELIQNVARLSRTQFRANALSESREQQLASALATLQEIATRREKVEEARLWQEQQQRAAARAEARGELIADLLPVLDGVELALESGQAFLERRRHQLAQERAQRVAQHQEARGVWQRLRGIFAPLGISRDEPEAQVSFPVRQAADKAVDEVAEVLAGWLQGLELIQERFLGVLAAEGIQAIPALGQPFDPHLHLAVATELRDDVAPGTIVSVRRKGYRQRERVLRYAEVVVARPTRPLDAQPTGLAADAGPAPEAPEATAG